MDPSHPQMHYHLARALMHLNQLASFRFLSTWGLGCQPSHPTPPWTKLGPSSSHLRSFANGFSSPASLSPHGGNPSHLVMNPEPHLRAISYRSLLRDDNSINRVVSSPPPSPRGIARTEEDHHSASEPPFPRAKPAPRTTLYQTISTLPDHPSTDTRSAKRPRTTYMVESGLPRKEPLPMPVSRHSIPEPEADPPPLHHRSVDSDSDEPTRLLQEPHLQHRPFQVMSLLPRSFLWILRNPVLNPLDPAIADHKNRPWPPCDDRS